MSAFTYSASSMNPSVTFPCHYSMTHSVTPQRHGILTNTYVPEDMTVPLFFIGDSFEKGELEGEHSLLDIAPTIAFVMGFQPVADREGKSII